MVAETTHLALVIERFEFRGEQGLRAIVFEVIDNGDLAGCGSVKDIIQVEGDKAVPRLRRLVTDLHGRDMEVWDHNIGLRRSYKPSGNLTAFTEALKRARTAHS